MPSPDPPRDASACIAGRYVVEAELGRGGMGTVYRVRDLRSDRVMALKRSSGRSARKAQRRSALLEREYHTLSQLAHPSIIEVYEYGIDDRGPYYTMELLDGADLDKAEPRSWKETCALLYNVASSLAILHARGLLHRDVSARNVRCTAEGRAKLIDFGGMAPMGVAKEVVGTPPFMAPEVLQMQELDARADLFSLGALGYFMLTGRHAYPARRLSELRDVWRSRPAPLARLAPDMPEALAALIHQLLMLDRNARPHSAAEVMERLAAIAGLPVEERGEVSRAYLARPNLVARNEQIVELRRRLLGLVRGDGSAAAVQGVSGSGRSRLLDAVVLEAKLLGIAVLRADAGDGARGEWGVARALCLQLQELMPEQADKAARLSRDVLAHVIDGVAAEASVTTSTAMPERGLLLRELREFVLAMSRVQRLLVVVDDADRIDEPSAALLAALAHKVERQPLLLVVATALDHEAEDPLSGSLRLFLQAAAKIAIEPLQAHETELLMRSVFGDVANLQFVAGRIHALGAGNPRDAMELAQHLVQRGLCRYEAGSWSLPGKLDEDELPSTLAGSLSRRLAELDPDARELADALCLADEDGLSLEDYPGLLGSQDPRRVYHALDELTAARVLRAVGDRYRFSQQGFVTVLREQLSRARRTAIHSRIAELLAGHGGDVLRRAHHLLHGGREREAIDLLCSLDLLARLPPVPLVELAIEQAERHGFPARTIQQLRTALLSKASVVLSSESFLRAFPPVLACIERDSGLALYRELADLPAPERLTQALQRTQQRYLATPEHERVYPVVDAVRELARLAGALCSFSLQLMDCDALAALPPLDPLLSLSPAMPLVNAIVQAHGHWVAGRYALGAQLYAQQLERIAQPDRAGLDESQYRRTYYGLQYMMGLYEGTLGIGRAAARAEALEREREYRVNAWRIRMLMHIRQGNADEARRCQRRAELSLLQEGADQRYLGMGAGFELVASAAAGDLAGIKAGIEGVAALSRLHPSWQAYVHYGVGRQRWLQGDLGGALDAVLAGLEVAPATRNNSFVFLSGAHVALLLELGRIDEALSFGRAYADVYERERMVALDNESLMAFAKTLARAGHHDEAVARIEGAIAAAQALGVEGLALGALYETRTQIATWMGDIDSFDHFSELCAVEYKKAHNPALSARFARLIDEAKERDVVSMPPMPVVRDLLDSLDTHVGHNTIQSRMLECVDDSDRARCALTLLLQDTESCAGYLYGVRDGKASLLAALPSDQTDPGLAAWIEQRLRAEVESDASVTASLDPQESVEGSERYRDADGRLFEPVFLLAREGEVIKIAAVLALHVSSAPRTVIDRDLTSDIARELLHRGDVTGVALEQEQLTRG